MRAQRIVFDPLVYKLAKDKLYDYILGNRVLLDLKGLFGFVDSILVHRRVENRCEITRLVECTQIIWRAGQTR